MTLQTLSLASHFTFLNNGNLTWGENAHRSKTPKLNAFFSRATCPLHFITLQWRHNEHNGVSNHQPHDCLLSRIFRRRSKKRLKLRVTGLCEGNSPVTGEFPTQRASYAENVFIWWRHHNITHFVSPQCLNRLSVSRTYQHLSTDLTKLTPSVILFCGNTWGWLLG